MRSAMLPRNEKWAIKVALLRRFGAPSADYQGLAFTVAMANLFVLAASKYHNTLDHLHEDFPSCKIAHFDGTCRSRFSKTVLHRTLVRSAKKSCVRANVPTASVHVRTRVEVENPANNWLVVSGNR